LIEDQEVLMEAVTVSVSTADTDYIPDAPDTIAVQVFDDDEPGLQVVSHSMPVDGSAALVEGGVGISVGLKLLAQPTSNVRISATVTASHTAVTASPSSILVAPSDWNTVQTFTFTASDDDIDRADGTVEVTFTLSSSDPDFSGWVDADGQPMGSQLVCRMMTLLQWSYQGKAVMMC
jgi:hypothetical protein